MSRPTTLGALRTSGWQSVPVKEEMRRNALRLLRAGAPMFPGIVGYDRTVLPALQNAILSRHDFILLGLRGQAKSRILRGLANFLDDAIPAVAGCDINDDPLAPICRRCRRLVAEQGDALAIAWIARDERYREKLATPDVTMADLIGDIDPIKAANERRSLSDEEVIHYGIIPRTNRGIFAINELPDLPTRIQVGLLNILEERDVQIRGFPIRLPIDVCVVFSANPEDYTNRGSIITPLKDRIDSQILTHYPRSVAEAMAITEQEAWTKRAGAVEVRMPAFMRELVEAVAFAARKSEFVDQSSGVSARLSIAAMENVVSNAERRAIALGEPYGYPRICDVYAAMPAVTGKIELVYEGEQQGVTGVAKRVIGQAIQDLFGRLFPPAYAPRPAASRRPERRGPAPSERGELKGSRDPVDDGSPYKPIVDWFAAGNVLEINDRMPAADYARALGRVPSLREIVKERLKPATDDELWAGMELVVEGLHQHSLVAREDLDGGVSYKDMLKSMFASMEDPGDE